MRKNIFCFHLKQLPLRKFHLIKYLSCVVVAFFLNACTNSKFENYTKTKNGLLFKMLVLGDGDVKAKPGDYITASVEVKLENDSILFSTKKFGPSGAVTFVLLPSQFDKDYREGFQFLEEGDSAVFISDAYSTCMKTFHQMIPKTVNLQSRILIGVKLLQIRTQQEHLKDMEALKRKSESAEFEEKKERDKYLATIRGPLVDMNGMVCVLFSEGNGIKLDSGRIALINYKGYFLNGRCFDSSFETQPFEYNIYEEQQVIKGLEIGLKKMREGGKAKFIIPSYLAYGSSGSSSGVVPPFTTVVYEVEILKVL